MSRTMRVLFNNGTMAVAPGCSINSMSVVMPLSRVTFSFIRLYTLPRWTVVRLFMVVVIFCPYLRKKANELKMANPLN